MSEELESRGEFEEKVLPFLKEIEKQGVNWVILGVSQGIDIVLTKGGRHFCFTNTFLDMKGFNENVCKMAYFRRDLELEIYLYLKVDVTENKRYTKEAIKTKICGEAVEFFREKIKSIADEKEFENKFAIFINERDYEIAKQITLPVAYISYLGFIIEDGEIRIKEIGDRGNEVRRL